MKKIFLLVLFTALITGNLHAQAKQQRMVLEQIAGLKVYIGYAQKGYSAVKKGLNTIGDFKRGEFNLHTDYLNSLKVVNPKIKKYARVTEIIGLQTKIMKSYKSLHQQIRQDDLFHGDELDYIEKAFERLIDNCNGTLDQLLTISTDAKLEMTDDQRLEHIDSLYAAMMADYSFCQHFSQEIEILSLSKAKERKDVGQSKILNGL